MSCFTINFAGFLLLHLSFMNKQVKTILLTILTLSVFTIAIIELSGISTRALFNKYGIGTQPAHATEPGERNERMNRANSMPKTAIYFYEEHFDFGKIKEGAVVQHAFRFKNLGEHPLLISDVAASCGCTVPTFSKEPVLPGNEGEILVEFNSKGRTGKNHKSVMVFSNADRERLSISFDVEVE
jgi:hypothetical protein